MRTDSRTYEFTGHVKSLRLRSPETRGNGSSYKESGQVSICVQSHAQDEEKFSRSITTNSHGRDSSLDFSLVDDKGQKPTRSLYITPLSRVINGYIINATCAKYGKVESTSPAGAVNVSKGYAFVNFYDTEGAVRAFKELKAKNPFGGVDDLTVRFKDSDPHNHHQDQARGRRNPSRDEGNVHGPQSTELVSDSLTSITTRELSVGTDHKGLKAWPNGPPPSGPRTRKTDISPPPIRRREHSHSYRPLPDTYRPSYDAQEDSPGRARQSDPTCSAHRAEDHRSLMVFSAPVNAPSSAKTTRAEAANTTASSTRISSQRIENITGNVVADALEVSSPAQINRSEDYFSYSRLGLRPLAESPSQPGRAIYTAHDDRLHEEDTDAYSPSYTVPTLEMNNGKTAEAHPATSDVLKRSYNPLTSVRELNEPSLRLALGDDLVQNKGASTSQNGSTVSRLRAANDETSSVLSERTSSSRTSYKNRKCNDCGVPGSEVSPLVQCSTCSRRFHKCCGNPRPSSFQNPQDFVCGKCHRERNEQPTTQSNVPALSSVKFERQSRPLTPPPDAEGSPKQVTADGILADKESTSHVTTSGRYQEGSFPQMGGMITPGTPVDVSLMFSPVSSINQHMPIKSGQSRRSSGFRDIQLEMQRSIQILYMYKTAIECSHWKSGLCSRTDSLCLYAHERTGFLTPFSMRKADQRWTCFDWLMNGYCKLEEKCFYAHHDTGFHLGPDGKCSMKHITCFYWNQGSCQRSALECVYAHRDTGLYAARPGSESVKLGLNLTTATGQTVGALLEKLYDINYIRDASKKDNPGTVLDPKSIGTGSRSDGQRARNSLDAGVSRLPIWAQSARGATNLKFTPDCASPSFAVGTQGDISSSTALLNVGQATPHTTSLRTENPESFASRIASPTRSAILQPLNQNIERSPVRHGALKTDAVFDPRRRREVVSAATSNAGLIAENSLSRDLHPGNGDDCGLGIGAIATDLPPLDTGVCETSSAKTFKLCDKCLRRIFSNATQCTRCTEENDDPSIVTSFAAAGSGYDVARPTEGLDEIEIPSVDVDNDAILEATVDELDVIEADDSVRITRPKVLKRRVDENKMFVPKKRVRLDVEGKVPWSSDTPFSVVPRDNPLRTPLTPSISRNIGETEKETHNDSEQGDLSHTHASADHETTSAPSRPGQAIEIDTSTDIPTQHEAVVPKIPQAMVDREPGRTVTTPSSTSSLTDEMEDNEASSARLKDINTGFRDDMLTHVAHFTCQRCRDHHKKCCHDYEGGLDPGKCKKYILDRQYRPDSGRSWPEWLGILKAGIADAWWLSPLEQHKAIERAMAEVKSYMRKEDVRSILPTPGASKHPLLPQNAEATLERHVPVDQDESSDEDRPLMLRKRISQYLSPSQTSASSEALSTGVIYGQSKVHTHENRKRPREEIPPEEIQEPDYSSDIDSLTGHRSFKRVRIASRGFAISTSARQDLWTRQDNDTATAKLKRRGVMVETDSSSDSDKDGQEDDELESAISAPNKALDLFQICPQLHPRFNPRKGPRVMKPTLGVASLLALQCQERRKMYGNPHHEIERKLPNRVVEVTAEVEVSGNQRQETPGPYHISIMEKRQVKKAFRDWLGIPEDPVVCKLSNAKHSGVLAYREGAKDKDRWGRARIADEEKFPFIKA